MGVPTPAPTASPEVVAQRKRRNDAENTLLGLADSEEHKRAEWSAINVGPGATDEPGFKRKWATAEQIEARVKSRRQALAAALPPDKADAALKDQLSGRARRARSGSSRSALGSFDVSAPLGPDSILGGQ